jgi:tRNA-dihydrouridine synthase
VLDAAGKLGKILVGMNRALGEIPLTVKLRTGIKEGRNVSHNLMPRIASEWNPGCITVSRYQSSPKFSNELCSSTAERVNNDTRNLQTGITSKNVSLQCVLVKLMKTVRT